MRVVAAQRPPRKAPRGTAADRGRGSFYLRSVSMTVIARARFRAHHEGRTMRWVMIQALHAYGTGQWTPQPWGS